VQVMSSSVKPRLAGQQPSHSRWGAPGEDLALVTRPVQARGSRGLIRRRKPMKDNGSQQASHRSQRLVLRRHIDLLRVSSALCLL
jgi:hypothetical protein